jgi:hypothetical protein
MLIKGRCSETLRPSRALQNLMWKSFRQV